jgi:hypothetical protein
MRYEPDSEHASLPNAFCKLTLAPGAGHHAAFKSGQVREAPCDAHRTRVLDLGPLTGPGLCKAVALESSVPITAIPTAYGGSEMTPVYGQTEDGPKVSGPTCVCLPETVIYIPELSLELTPGTQTRPAREVESLAKDCLPTRPLGWARSGCLSRSSGVHARLNMLPDNVVIIGFL